MVCLLATSCCWGQTDRPRKRTIRALTAIDVSAGAEKIKYRASLPWMISQVLVYSGQKADYVDFCAISGWSAEFHYQFDKLWVSYLAVEGLPSGRCFSRGVQNYGKQLSVFAWPQADAEAQRLLGARAAWEFIVTNIAADRPVLTDYIDGGVFYAYDETLRDPEVSFSTNGPGAGPLTRSRFNELFQTELHGLAVITDGTAAPSPKALLLGTLANTLMKAYETEAEGAPAGIAAMQKLGADLVGDERDWAQKPDWLCWPLGNQTETRLCTAVYLRRNATLLGEGVRPHLLAAADHYEAAFKAWQRRWDASYLRGGKPDDRTDAERLVDPGRREAIAGCVYEALGHELLALSEVQQALMAAQISQIEQDEPVG